MGLQNHSGNKSFCDAIREAKFDIFQAYKTLLSFYLENSHFSGGSSIREAIKNNFHNAYLKFKSSSLDEFEKKVEFNPYNPPKSPTIDEYLFLCEYLYNLIYWCDLENDIMVDHQYVIECTNYIWQSLDELGYHMFNDGELIHFVLQCPSTKLVQEQSQDDITTLTNKYEHYSSRGKLSNKAGILSSLAMYVEPKRKELEKIDKSRTTMLFNALNNLNIRHNNKDANNPSKFNPPLLEISDKDLEEKYDYLYQLIILSLLQLQTKEGAHDFEEFLKKITNKE